MKLIMETISGRKGIKEFKNLDEYINFMTKNSHKIKKIVESDMPYDDKPVELPKVSSSQGWEQIDNSAFGDIDSDGEKGDCLLPQGNQGVFKNNAQFEPSKSSEKSDTQEMPKVEKSPVKTSENGDEKEVKEFTYNDSDEKEEKSDDKEDKKEKVNESFKDYLPRTGFIRDDKTNEKQGAFFGQGTDDQLRKAKIIAKVKFANGDRMGRVSKSDLDNFDEYYAQYKEIYGQIDEAVETQPDMFDSEYDTKYVDGVQTYSFHDINNFMSEIAPNLSYTKDVEKDGKIYLGYQGKNLDSKEFKRIKESIKNRFQDNVQVQLARAEYAPEQKTLYVSYIETPDDDQLDEALSPNQTNEYTDEYFVYLFMIAYGKTDANNQTFRRIVNSLIKEDKRFVKVNERFLSFINENGSKYPSETLVKALCRLAGSMGISENILDKAIQTFKSEELNESTDSEESDNFDDEIAETLKIAGVNINEDYYNQADDEIDNGQDYDDEKIVQEIKQIMKDEDISEEEAISYYATMADMDEKMVKSIYDEYNHLDENFDEQLNNEDDGDIDEKTGKEKLFEEEPEESEESEESELEKAKKQVEAWEEYIKHQEIANDMYYTSGAYDRDHYNLYQWEKRVKELSQKIDESDNETLEETKPARFNQHLGKDKSFANISASRSNDEFEKPGMEKEKQKQSEENNRKTAQLKRDIKDMGLSYIKTYGAWRDEGPVTQEDSFLIPNITKEQALELGKKYGQYSVIFKDEGDDTAYMYITLDGDDFGKKDMAFDMSKDAKFSQVKKGKDELDPYSGWTGLKPGGKGYNLSYNVKDED